MKNREMLKCRDGCGLDVKAGVVWMLESQIRFMKEDFGIDNYEPIISCGARCPKHNKEIGGADNSAHLIGEAVDQAYRDDFECFRILRFLSILKVKRIIIYPNNHFIHWDSACGKQLPNGSGTYQEYYNIKL